MLTNFFQSSDGVQRFAESVNRTALQVLLAAGFIVPTIKLVTGSELKLFAFIGPALFSVALFGLLKKQYRGPCAAIGLSIVVLSLPGFLFFNGASTLSYLPLLAALIGLYFRLTQSAILIAYVLAAPFFVNQIVPLDNHEYWFRSLASSLILYAIAAFFRNVVRLMLDTLVNRNSELEQAAQRQAMAAQTAKCGFWSFVWGSNETNWDTQTYAIWELEPDSLRGAELFKFWSESLDPADRQRVIDNEETLFRDGRSGDIGHHQFKITTAKGNCRWVEASFTLVRDERQSMFLGMNRDITEEHDLRDQLQVVADKAVELAEAKSHFLANMSHEIRTPLNAVMGLAQQLTRRSRYSTEVVSHAGKIVKAGQSLLSLLNDILDFSKLDSGKLQLSSAPVDLFDMLDNLATLMTNSARHKQLELIIRAPHKLGSRVETDQLRLEQILINLVGNAIKFTEQGYIALIVDLVEQTDSRIELRFTVRDSGIGISQVDLQKLTAPFVQADASITRRYGGTGLGLSICKRLLSLFGSELEITSKPGQGSEFAFSLTLEPSPSTEVETNEYRQISLMLADDHEIAREALTATADTLGWQTEATSSGGALLERLKQHLDEKQPVDLVLLDWKMPELDGAETAKRIKHLCSEYGVSKPPVVVMVSGYSLEHLEDTPQAEYIDRIMEKPVTPTRLRNIYRAITQSEPESIPKGEQPLEGLLLLVVDDNLYNRDVAKIILESEGATVEVVEDGLSAVEWIQKNSQQVSAVLMDVQMPFMDGLQATRAIREDHAIRHVPIIGMSAGAFESDIQAALEAGMDGYLTKPIDIRTTVMKLVDVLQLEYRESSYELSQESGKRLGGNPNAIFDKQMAIKIWSDEAKLNRTLAAFISEFTPYMHPERLFVATPDPGIVHKMKGASGALFLQRLHTCLRDMEPALKHACTSPEEITQMVEIWQATVAEVEKYVSSNPSDQKDVPIPSGAGLTIKQLEQLQSACSSYDPDEVRLLLAKFAEIGDSRLLREIDIKISQFDFAAAEKLIREELEVRSGE